VNSGQRLIDDALKMISGCVVPSSTIVNNGSFSTTYLGSVLSVSSQVQSVIEVELSSSAGLLVSTEHQSGGDVAAHAFATTLLPASVVFNSCFRRRSTLADPTVCRSAVLNFGAGNCLWMLPKNCFCCWQSNVY